MTSLRAEVKMKLRCNVCDDIIIKKKYNVQCRAERYSLIVISDSALF